MRVHFFPQGLTRACTHACTQALKQATLTRKHDHHRPRRHTLALAKGARKMRRRLCWIARVARSFLISAAMSSCTHVGYSSTTSTKIWRDSTMHQTGASAWYSTVMPAELRHVASPSRPFSPKKSPGLSVPRVEPSGKLILTMPYLSRYMRSLSMAAFAIANPGGKVTGCMRANRSTSKSSR